MTGSIGSPAQSGVRLQEIADALGIPVSALHDQGAPMPFVEVRDLVREYVAITDAQGRQRVMNVVRREAARCRTQAEVDPSAG